jgi:hypothetical protein
MMNAFLWKQWRLEACQDWSLFHWGVIHLQHCTIQNSYVKKQIFYKFNSRKNRERCCRMRGNYIFTSCFPEHSASEICARQERGKMCEHIRTRTRHWTTLRYWVLVFSVESKLEKKLVVSLSCRLGVARDTKVSISASRIIKSCESGYTACKEIITYFHKIVANFVAIVSIAEKLSSCANGRILRWN